MTSPGLRKSEPPLPSTPVTRTRRHMATLSHPKETADLIPASPSLKRTNSGTLKSPDYRLNTNDVMSPGLLATPRGTAYDSDDKEALVKLKLTRTPLFFSPKARIGDENTPLKEDLSHISHQLKDKLSLALGSVQRKERHSVSPSRLNFAESFWLGTALESPTRRKGSFAQSPSRNLAAASINLQTLQKSPCVFSNSRRHLPSSTFGLQQLANFTCEQPLKLPSPDETSAQSAQSALLEAFSRSQKRRQSDANEHQSPLGSTSSIQGSLHVLPFQLPDSKPRNVPFTHPSNSVAEPLKTKDDSEQDAVLLLMSLASPRGVKKPLGDSFTVPAGRLPGHTRTPSNGAPILAPLVERPMKVDDDETDIEEASSSDEE